MLIHLENKAQFDEIIRNNKKVLVDFFATWCGPCQMLAPVLEEIAGEMEDVTIVKVDVDDYPNIAERFSVFSIPTLVLFKDGQQVDKRVGYMSKDALAGLLK